MAIELMVTDCLLEADQDLGLSQQVNDAETFQWLDDSLLRVRLCSLLVIVIVLVL